MPFERPTLQEISDRIQSDFQTRITGGSSMLRRSVLRVMGRVFAGAVWGLYGFLSFMKDQLFASTADSENLEIHGSEYSILRKAAVGAAGYIEVTGTNNTDVPLGTQLEAPDGQLYEVTETTTIVGTTADVPVEAVTAGADSNQAAAVTLTFISPISGVDSDATIDSAGLTGGLDEEDDDELRARILTRKRQPPHGGAEFDYEAWALEVAGVTRAWAFPQYMGVGTIGVAFVRDNDTATIIPNDTQREEVKDYIIEHADPLTGLEVGIPATAEPGLFIIDISEQAQDFTIQIYPNTSAVQAQVEEQLEEIINVDGGPGETVYHTALSVAISQAAGLIAHKITNPTDDIGVATNKVLRLGTITFQDYQ